jgi:hypothetical protein
MMDIIEQYRDAQQVLRNNMLMAHPERIIRDRINPFELFTGPEFIRRFRFSKQNVVTIIELISVDISPKADRHFAVPPHLQVLIALQFYATGAFQITVGDLIRLHQTTVSRIVKRVSIALADKKQQFVKFPCRENVANVKENFYNIAGIPTIIGAIDCSHIRISNPGGEDAMRFINRKGYFSLNCQFTCDANLTFTNVCGQVARWSTRLKDI